jgi:catechol 2,3-dioxygenase-like lactoylglutathione lyase family enzyme
MTRATTQAISPFFIVSNVDQTIAFYCGKLGFETKFQQPDRNPFFAIVGRDGAQIFVKSDKDTSPLPNPKRNPSMRWDAYVYAPDPDALAVEFADHGAAFSVPLKDTHDGLRGFESTLTATSCSSADQGARPHSDHGRWMNFWVGDDLAKRPLIGRWQKIPISPTTGS